jgi:hypothetical protein
MRQTLKGHELIRLFGHIPSTVRPLRTNKILPLADREWCTVRLYLAGWPIKEHLC